MRYPRYICIHGHFYQPPRENPWLGAIEVEDSAAPFHDWNERITRECYAPNTRSRLLGHDGRIIRIMNNYAWISFNFGPTLLSWIARHAPEVHQGIVEADQLSRARCGGHGNALAQVYNHLIMPLASRHDKETQVAWGVADFRHRFGRDPEGMWLAETAVDIESLEVLAAAGITFTILAPRQARRWRELGTREWHELPGGIDPSRAYKCRLPSGRSIALFFLDAIVSHRVAFERLLDDGERFLNCLSEGFDDRREHAQLMHIATDGESYGHHHAHGDMALAYALGRLADDSKVILTNYGEFLELHPPECEVEIHENSSWSCVHGIERWRSDCGCRTRGEWNQRWRASLRRALDGLKARLDQLFRTRGRECFPEPWLARNAYIDVILNREDDHAIGSFIAQYCLPDLDPAQAVAALRLLEMQTDAMLMFTSCGWFHDEISGMETIQCLQYASRAIELARQFDRELEDRFTADLEQAPSNVSRFGNGRGVWEQLVRPSVVDLERVLVHRAISLIYQPAGDGGRQRVYSFELETLEKEVRQRGKGHLAVGRLRARSLRTWNEAEARFVVIHYGGLDFHAVLCLGSACGPESFESLKPRLLDAYKTGSLADITSLVAREFPGRSHRLDDLFRDEQRRIIGIVLEERFADYERSFALLANQDEEVLNRLGQLNYPIPKPLRAAASTFLDQHLAEEVHRLARGDSASLGAIEQLHERGQGWGYERERGLLERMIADALARTLEEIRPDADLDGIVARAELLLAAATRLGAAPDLWQVQNRFLNALGELFNARIIDAPLRRAFESLAADLKIGNSLLGRRP
jgi:alpha-amylase/alpha-mannosidase (GH57 family)